MTIARTSGSICHHCRILFTQWNLLIHDVQIGHTTRVLGWLGMLTAAVWLAFRAYHSRQN